MLQERCFKATKNKDEIAGLETKSEQLDQCNQELKIDVNDLNTVNEGIDKIQRRLNDIEQYPSDEQ